MYDYEQVVGGSKDGMWFVHRVNEDGTTIIDPTARYFRTEDEAEGHTLLLNAQL